MTTALESRYALRLAAPLWRSTAIGRSNRREEEPGRLLLSPKHAPPDTLGGHLEFALKWEGIELSLLKQLFATVPANELREVVFAKPAGAYTRRLRFLYEWLTDEMLDLPDPGKVRAIPAVDTKQQFALARGVLSSRHRVLNNLPGTATFCPMHAATEHRDTGESAGAVRGGGPGNCRCRSGVRVCMYPPFRRW